jgi:DNA (cytosine-5)-methyltransferase 1
MNVLDLFSGIGGFSLGLERAGMRTVAFCEIDPWCRRVLAKHWPDVHVFRDVRELTAASLCEALADANERQCHFIAKTAGRSEPDTGYIDVVCGGFPCQDISFAGKGAGLAGERSGLWTEFARIIGEVRPRYAIIENVAALLHRGLVEVLCDLTALGYDAEWHCIPASAAGAPHRRDRIWIVAHAGCERRDGRGGQCGGQEAARTCDRPARSGQHAEHVAHANGAGCIEQRWGESIRAQPRCRSMR